MKLRKNIQEAPMAKGEKREAEGTESIHIRINGRMWKEKYIRGGQTECTR